MGIISVEQFDTGLDVRKGASTAPASTMRVLNNAYVTIGKSIKKRPGLKLFSAVPLYSAGLVAANGFLNVFSSPAFVSPAISINWAVIRNITLSDTSPMITPIIGVRFAQMFNGFLYVVANYANNVTQHHYVDGNADTRVLDPACPQSDVVVYGASKLYCAAGSDVVFCSVNNPRSWTMPVGIASPSTAGMLAVGKQQAFGSISVSALGLFKGMLTVFFNDSIQMWSVDPNPANDRKIDTLGAGCAYKFSLANMVNDLFFMSHNGVRSITRSTTMMGNWQDFDIGSQIDSLISEVRGSDMYADYTHGIYLNSLGQYWVWRSHLGKTVAFVFSFSQSAGLSAWSRYEFGVVFDALVELNGVVYVRVGGFIYTLDSATYQDEISGAIPLPIVVNLETAFIDMQSPQALKQIYGLDYVVQGTAELKMRYDPRDPTQVTYPIVISGDSRPGQLTSVELCSTHCALSITHSAKEAFELSQFSLHFNKLGTR